MNARKEFLEEVADKNVKCAKLYRRVSDDEEDDVYYNLSCGFTIEDYEKFLNKWSDNPKKNLTILKEFMRRL